MKCRIQIPSIVQTMIFSVLEISLRFFTLPLLSDVSCVNASKETSKSSAKHIRLPVLGLDMPLSHFDTAWIPANPH